MRFLGRATIEAHFEPRPSSIAPQRAPVIDSGRIRSQSFHFEETSDIVAKQAALVRRMISVQRGVGDGGGAWFVANYDKISPEIGTGNAPVGK
jgi:hypothetical protein